jgi:hypothetical protein
MIYEIGRADYLVVHACQASLLEVHCFGKPSLLNQFCLANVKYAGSCTPVSVFNVIRENEKNLHFLFGLSDAFHRKLPRQRASFTFQFKFALLGIFVVL